MLKCLVYIRNEVSFWPGFFWVHHVGHRIVLQLNWPSKRLPRSLWSSFVESFFTYTVEQFCDVISRQSKENKITCRIVKINKCTVDARLSNIICCVTMTQWNRNISCILIFSSQQRRVNMHLRMWNNSF